MAAFGSSSRIRARAARCHRLYEGRAGRRDPDGDHAGRHDPGRDDPGRHDPGGNETHRHDANDNQADREHSDADNTDGDAADRDNADRHIAHGDHIAGVTCAVASIDATAADADVDERDTRPRPSRAVLTSWNYLIPMAYLPFGRRATVSDEVGKPRPTCPERSERTPVHCWIYYPWLRSQRDHDGQGSQQEPGRRKDEPLPIRGTEHVDHGHQRIEACLCPHADADNPPATAGRRHSPDRANTNPIAASTSSP